MVLCMQREMEDLKEQLRCLTGQYFLILLGILIYRIAWIKSSHLILTTACGKLARNLEMLIEKTQMWSNGNNGISLGTPVSQGTPQAPAEADAVIPDVRSPPAIVNGQWLNQGPGPQKPHEAAQNAQRDGLFTEVVYDYVSIKSYKLNSCPKLECRIKHLRIQHCFHPVRWREQNRHFLMN